MFDEQVTMATLNTRGVPVVGTHLAGRFAVIGAKVEVDRSSCRATSSRLIPVAYPAPSKFHDHTAAALYGAPRHTPR